MARKIISALIGMGIIAAGMSLLTACNTVEGTGRDMQSMTGPTEEPHHKHHHMMKHHEEEQAKTTAHHHKKVMKVSGDASSSEQNVNADGASNQHNDSADSSNAAGQPEHGAPSSSQQ